MITKCRFLVLTTAVFTLFSSSPGAYAREVGTSLKLVSPEAIEPRFLKASDAKGPLVLMDVPSTFNQNARLYLAFLKDWIEYSAVTSKVFGSNLDSAPTFNELDPKALVVLKSVFWQVEHYMDELQSSSLRGIESSFAPRFHSPTHDLNPMLAVAPSSANWAVNRQYPQDLRHLHRSAFREVGALIALINIGFNDYVYTDSPRYAPAEQFQNLTLSQPGIVQFRGVPHVDDPLVYSAFTKLVKGRLKFVAQQGLKDKFKGLKMAFDDQHAVDLFYGFASEAGLSLEETKALLQPKFQRIKPSELAECRALLVSGF